MARTEIRFEVRLEGEADSFREAKRRAFISFDIIGREIGDYSNWLDVQISALFGNLHGISNATMESYDFRRLQAVLQKLLSGSSQKEEFSPLEPWITIEFCIKEDGSIWAEGDLNDELGPGYYLHFHFKMNRQQIESAIASCERVVLA